MLLVSKLDDGNNSSIVRVLEIKAKELVFILVKPSLQIGKKTRDPSAVVRVDDIEKGLAWCWNIQKPSTNLIHVEDWGISEEKKRKKRAHTHCSNVSVFYPSRLEQHPKRAEGKRFGL